MRGEDGGRTGYQWYLLEPQTRKIVGLLLPGISNVRHYRCDFVRQAWSSEPQAGKIVGLRQMRRLVESTIKAMSQCYGQGHGQSHDQG